MFKECIAVLCLLFLLPLVLAESGEENNSKNVEDNTMARAIEEGRTLVHHTVKRMMIILPAIFFKLGIAFTMLIIVTLVSINNGFIGFLLLVVGLSSVLARLQESRKSAALPYLAPLPPYYHHQLFDRSDKLTTEKNTNYGTVGTIPYASYQYYTPPLKYT